MADFTSIYGIMNNIRNAEDILRVFKNIYGACVEVETILARYQTDPAFKDEADHLYTGTQLIEINQMIQNVTTLRTAWATNHQGPLGLGTL